MNTPFNVSWNKEPKTSQNASAGRLAREALKAKAREYGLDQGKTLHFDGDQRGMIVKSLFGKLWLTQENDLEDYMLTPGEAVVVQKRGRVVLEATQDSLVSITPAA
jgi:hypothetical protein